MAKMNKQTNLKLKFCKKCDQMTNHDKSGNCLKCPWKKEKKYGKQF